MQKIELIMNSEIGSAINQDQLQSVVHARLQLQITSKHQNTIKRLFKTFFLKVFNKEQTRRSNKYTKFYTSSLKFELQLACQGNLSLNF